MTLTTSIIIPVFNDGHRLPALIEQINFCRSGFECELIIVDNGSTDGTEEIVSVMDGLVFLKETKHLGSPYSARNRGIEAATGEVIVLLDATCMPSDGWLQKGLECLEESGSDMVGGAVLFDFEGRITVAKIFDALTNIKMKESIELRAVAKTANLFIRREVFDEVGMFPEGVRSGADVRWTGKATEAGKKLTFCSGAKVYKVARGFRELLRKQWRVGKGRAAIDPRQKKNTGGASVMKKFFNIDQKAFRELHRNAGDGFIPLLGIRLFLLGGLIKVTMLLASGMQRFKKR